MQILQDAMRKTFADTEFFREYQKLEASHHRLFMPEALEKVVKELPRDNEVIELFNKLAGAEPLPAR